MHQEGPKVAVFIVEGSRGVDDRWDGYHIEFLAPSSGCVPSMFRARSPVVWFFLRSVRLTLDSARACIARRITMHSRLARDRLCFITREPFSSSSLSCSAPACLARSASPARSRFLPLLLRPMRSFPFDKSPPETRAKSGIADSRSRYLIGGQKLASARVLEDGPISGRSVRDNFSTFSRHNAPVCARYCCAIARDVCASANQAISPRRIEQVFCRDVFYLPPFPVRSFLVES